MLGKRKGGRKDVWKGGKDGGRERRREQGKTSIHFYFRMILCFEVERSKQWKRIRNVSLNTMTLKTISLHLAPTSVTNSHCSQCWENQRHVKHGPLCLNILNSSCRITANKDIYIYMKELQRMWYTFWVMAITDILRGKRSLGTDTAGEVFWRRWCWSQAVRWTRCFPIYASH